MSDEVAKKVEDVVPEVPTSEPPVEAPAAVATEEVVAEETPAAAATEETPAAPEEKKKSGGVARRFTFNKRWGKHRDAEPAAPKEPEAPKDPKEDVLGWIAQQIPQAVHKVSRWSRNSCLAGMRFRLETEPTRFSRPLARIRKLGAI